MTTIQGHAAHQDGRIAIVISRFNEPVTSKLLAGALEALQKADVPKAKVDLVHVPGAFELPLAVEKLLKKKGYVGVVALGAVIRGDTPHFDYVCNECSRGIMDVMRQYQVPVSFGVITTDTAQQAYDRCGGKKGNKGADAVAALLEMIDVCQQVDGLKHD